MQNSFNGIIKSVIKSKWLWVIYSGVTILYIVFHYFNKLNEWVYGTNESFLPCIKNIGHFTYLIFYLFLNLSAIRNLKNPTWFSATSFIHVNGLIRIRHLMPYFDAIFQAGPEPIDLPKQIIFSSFQLPYFIRKLIRYYESFKISF